MSRKHKLNFINVKASDIMGKELHNRGWMIDAIFEVARAKAPSMIFFGGHSSIRTLCVHD